MGWLWKLISDNCCIKKNVFCHPTAPLHHKNMSRKKMREGFLISLLFIYIHVDFLVQCSSPSFVHVLWFGKDFFALSLPASHHHIL
jgi:hypothetical protein